MIKAQCTGFLNTPPLWKEEQFGIQQFDFPNLDLQHFHPVALPDNIRLGHQMEYVFKQLIEYSEAYKVILYNLQIRQRKRTLGEIDFILENTTDKKLIHVELTCKFYIIDSAISDPIHRVIGPNRKDSFFMKMEKIKNKQFPLLHTDNGINALKENNIDHHKIEHQCCFKAQLFHPYNDKNVDIKGLNMDCIAGYWLRFDEFHSAKFKEAQYYIPIKSEWVIVPNDQAIWRSHKEILIDVGIRIKNERAPMLWLKTKRGTYEKCFVVWW